MQGKMVDIEWNDACTMYIQHNVKSSVTYTDSCTLHVDYVW